MVQTVTSISENACPENGTDDKQDTSSNQAVPFVMRPENGTGSFLESVLSVDVSCFANYKSPDNPRTVNLLTWLRSSKYRKECEDIQTTADPDERKRKKAAIPAVTPSGEFSRRSDNALLKHSGIICLDIDLKLNGHIKNYADLKAQLSRIQNVAYCGRSVSGTGYFVLIPIAHPERHSDQFKALRELFKTKLGVRVDDTPDVSRLRGYAYDPDGYFNHQAKPFTGVYVAPPVAPSVRRLPSFYPKEKGNFDPLQQCIRLIEEACDGEKHTQLNKASYLAGGYVAAGLLDEAEAVSALEYAISQKPNVSDLQAASRTIRDAVRDGKQHPLQREEPAYAVPFSGRVTNGTATSYRKREPQDYHSGGNDLSPAEPPKERIEPLVWHSDPQLMVAPPFKLPALIEYWWEVFPRPPRSWNKIKTYISLLNCLEVNEHKPLPSDSGEVCPF